MRTHTPPVFSGLPQFCRTIALLLAAVTVGPAHSAETAATASSQPAPFNGPEILNPLRGQYRWGGTTVYGNHIGEAFPSASNPGYSAAQRWPGVNVSYYRFTWAEVQPRQGDTGFQRIEEVLDAAVARGERVGFRVMAADSCCAPMNSPRAIMPAWLVNLGVNPWTYAGGGETAVVPDWNNANYLHAMKTLIAQLGAKYDGDDRVAFVDMLGYGNFGEWHSFPMDSQYPRPAGQTDITDANARDLVDANLLAFRKTRLLSLTPNDAAFAHAMTRADVGIRVDCLGDATGGWAWPRMMALPASMTRWQTAPVLTEWCGSNYSSAAEVPAGSRYDGMRADLGKDLYQVGRRQVATWHVSLLSSGNFPHAWNGQVMRSAQWDDFAMANKTSGYRYTVAPTTPAAWPLSVTRGASLAVALTWKNIGAAPTYDPWQVWLELRPAGADHAAAWVQSSLDLRSFYTPDPGTAGAPGAASSQAVSDAIAIPASLPAGRYMLVVQVKGTGMEPPVSRLPAGYYQKLRMNLDNAQGRTSDGGYILGNVDVR